MVAVLGKLPIRWGNTHKPTAGSGCDWEKPRGFAEVRQKDSPGGAVEGNKVELHCERWKQ